MMKTLKLIIGEIIGLFLDDEFMAIAILALVALAALLAFALHATSLIVGGVLLVGCVLILIISTIRGARNA